MKNLFYCLFGLLFFSCNSIAQTDQERKPANLAFTAEADVISAVSGCYTLLVRVYMHSNGETSMVSWGTVQTGECGQRKGTNPNLTCIDQEFKGDYFYYTVDSLKYCLVELLQDKEIYSKYVIEKDRVLESIKK
jgi:hypothetical protein